MEGYCKVEGGKIWYEVHSPQSDENVPIIFIHGGPGYTHNSFKTLVGLSEKRKVIFYDQLGCGKSDRPSDYNLWTIERHVEELKALFLHLSLAHVYLLGHSWGTIIALEFASKYPDYVNGIVFASPCISVPKWVEDSKRLRKQLPAEIERELKLGEQLGEYYSAGYIAAANEYAKRFICRLDPKPQVLLDSDAQSGAEVYLAMWGPNEFTLKGNLSTYDGTEKLQELHNIPNVFTCGFYDEGTPEACTYYVENTENSSCVVFQESSHFPHVEEKDKYIEFLSSYLEDLDHGIELKKEFGKTKPSEIFAIILLLAFSLLVLLYIFVR